MAEAKLKSDPELLALIMNLRPALAKHYSKCRVLRAPKVQEGRRFVRLPCSPALLHGRAGISRPFPAPACHKMGSSVLGWKFFRGVCLKLPKRLPLARHSCPASGMVLMSKYHLEKANPSACGPHEPLPGLEEAGRATRNLIHGNYCSRLAWEKGKSKETMWIS